MIELVDRRIKILMIISLISSIISIFLSALINECIQMNTRLFLEGRISELKEGEVLMVCLSVI